MSIMGKRVTLADIARAVGVTPATVQRALKGLDGVGEEQRQRILKAAGEMDYRPNALASALKRGELCIALVLPGTENENQYYASSLWEGARAFLDGGGKYMVKVCAFPYERSPENLGRAMERMYGTLRGQVDGVITMGVRDKAFLEVCGRLSEDRVPYVFVGTDCREAGRLCCVAACNEVAGRMAADLFLNPGPGGGGRIILTGDFSIEDQMQNALGFERQMGLYGREFGIIKLVNYSGIQAAGREIAGLLAGGGIAGIYSTSARNTLAAAEALAETGSRATAVGSDIFPETIELLKSRRLCAVIHKRSHDQARRAAQLLVDHLLTGERPFGEEERILPLVVTNGSVSCFEGDRVVEGYFT